MRRWSARPLATAVILAFAASGCATNRAKTLVLMGGSALVAGTVAALVAPADERPEAHFALGAGLGASTAAIAGLFLFDEQKRAEELERQNGVLRHELDALEGTSSGEGPRELLYQSSATLERDLPSEYGKLLKPGSWSVYRIDHWVSQDNGTFIHQDRMLRLTPARFEPGLGLSLSISNSKNSTPVDGRPVEEGHISVAKNPEGAPAPLRGAKEPGEAL